MTPPLVIALLLGIFWKRFTPTAAVWTMVGGGLAIFATILFPELITPFAHGVPMKDAGDGLFDGKNQYKFMRGFFGLVICLGIGVTVTLLTKARPLEELKGLVFGTVSDALAHFKGAPGVERHTPWAQASVREAALGSDAMGRRACAPRVRSPTRSMPRARRHPLRERPARLARWSAQRTRQRRRDYRRGRLPPRGAR